MDAALARILLFIFLFNADFLVDSLKQGSKSRSLREAFIPADMLLISMPMDRKVSYVQLKNFKAEANVVLPLIDGGLGTPYGLAWDAPRSALYVCDETLRMIFRVEVEAFKCLRQCKGIPYHLRTRGKHTVVEGVKAAWADVDSKGNLYFSDQLTDSVNKLSIEFIEEMTADNPKISAKDLARVPEAVYAGQEAAREAFEDSSTRKATTSKPEPAIYELYAKTLSATVGTPAGIAVIGNNLYWTNSLGGFSHGSLSMGFTSPHVKPATSEDEDLPTFPSTMVTNISGSTYGLALTSNKYVFTDYQGKVWASSRASKEEVVPITTELAKPRGIAWDREDTIYVADQGSNNVVSMPAGMSREHAPVSWAVDIQGPFGLAFMSKSDPIWTDPSIIRRMLMDAAESRSRRFGSMHSWVAVLSFIATGMSSFQFFSSA